MPDAPARPPAAPLRAGAFASLHHRDFRLFYIGQLLSLVGTWMQSTAQGWLVLDLTNDELKLGIVTAVSTVPTLLFALYAGALADRSDKRRIIVRANAVALVLAAALGVLIATHTVTYGALLAIVFGLGTVSAFEIPTRQSFFVELVGADDLPNAIALNSSAFNASRIVGPAIAGWVIGALGVAACFFANAVSYVFVIAGLMMMRRPPFRAPERTAGTVENIREGLSYIRGHRVVRTLVWMIAAMSVLGFPFVMLMPVFARDVLHVGATGLGWLLSAMGTGALAGGLILAHLGSRVPRGRLLLGASIAFCAGIIAFSFSRSFPLSLALLAFVGFTMILNNATINSLLQSVTPNELRGRVMSVYVLMFVGTGPIGSLQAGAAARVLGAPVAVAAGAALLIGVIACVAWRVPEMLEIS